MTKNLSFNCTNTNHHDIYLLERSFAQNEYCKLQHFLNFTKINWGQKTLNFSYVPAKSNLIHNLTLKENIFLDSIPNSLTISKEFHFQSFFEKSSHQYLMELLSKIPDLERLPEEVSEKEKKIVCLIRGIIKETDYLFLEGLELSLSLETDLELREIIHHLILQEKKLSKRSVMISSLQPNYWQDLLGRRVLQNNQGEFLVEDQQPKVSKRASQQIMD